MIVAFIDDMRSQGHAVEPVCRVLSEQGCQIAARTYRAWRRANRPVAASTISDATVTSALLATTGTPEGLYGRRKMTHWLRRQGHEVAFCTVDRLMSDLGMSGVRRGKSVRTTGQGRTRRRPAEPEFTARHPTPLGRDHYADGPAQGTRGGGAATDRRTDLVLTPLRITLWDRDRQGHRVEPGELLHHSDAGSQYTSIRFTEHLALEGIAPSIGTVGDAYDNALMKSIIGLFKPEAIATTVFHDGPYKTIADIEYTVAGWVDWYNHRRLHGSLGMLTPDEYEQAHYAALQPQQQTAKEAAQNP